MRFLVTGASGLLGAELVRQLHAAGEAVVAWSGATAGAVEGIPLRQVNLADLNAVAAAFEEDRPDVILHAGALARVAECFARPDLAFRINEAASHRLAEFAAAAKARLIYVSTDMVFDGEKGNYRETDPACPLSVYGRSKLAGEKAVLAFPRTSVARLSLLLGAPPEGRTSFLLEQVNALRQGRPVTLFADEWRTPLPVSAAARALIAFGRSDFTGTLHIGGPERLTRLEMGVRMARVLGVSPDTIIASCRADVPGPEARPRDLSLDSSLWRALFPDVSWPVWEESLQFIAQLSKKE